MSVYGFQATIDAIRTDVATDFETLSDTALIEAGQQAVIEYGACHIQPQPKGNWGQEWHEITLLGVYASGKTFVEALRDWTKSSLRMHLQAEQERAA